MTSTSHERPGVFPSPTPGGWIAIVRDEHGKLRQLGVFQTKQEATGAFQTWRCACVVNLVARHIDALPFEGERTLSSARARQALHEAMESCQRGRSGMDGSAMRGATK
jgi:hypothetical protein